MLRLILLILISASSAIAESVVIGMDKEKVAITATFDGSQILLFGAVKRDKPAPLGDIQVIVTIAGPSEPISVHRKSKVFGIWMNTDTVEVYSGDMFNKPLATGKKISIIKLNNLLKSINLILDKAIKKGGSSISDYNNVDGDLGYFQNNFRVYGRKGLACFKCKNLILQFKQSGRSTFYCRNCQK